MREPGVHPTSPPDGPGPEPTGGVLEPEFEDDLSRRLWDDYLGRVETAVEPLRSGIRTELVREIKTHLLESIEKDDAEDEAERVLNATEKMGRPEAYLEPIVTDRMIEEGSTTFNPIWILKGLGRTLMRGVKAGLIGLLFGIGYLVALAVTSLAVLKPIFPNHVGLFYDPSTGLQRFAFGFLDNPAGRPEVLGYWIIPVSLLLGVGIYVALTKMLILLRKSD